MEEISESGSCIGCGNATTEKGRVVRKLSGFREVYFCSVCNKEGGIKGNGKGIGMVDDVLSHGFAAVSRVEAENRRKADASTPTDNPLVSFAAKVETP